MLQKISHILLLLILAFRSVAGTPVDETNLPQLLLTISDDLYYNFDGVIDKIDSIKGHLSEQQQLKYQPHFSYFKAYTAYRNSEYDRALAFADSALTYFLWNESGEWESRCILVMAFTAEALTLDNYALSYYETAAQMTRDNIVKGISILGTARSKRRLHVDYKYDVNLAVSLLEETGIKEIELLAKRSYYSFNTKDTNLVSELQEVANAYELLGQGLFAAVTNKQISYYYRDQKDFSSAVEYAQKAIRLIESTRDSVSVFSGSLYLYYSGLLLYQDKYDSAQDYIEKTIAINNDLNISQTNYYAYLRLSRLKRQENNYKEADINSQNAIVCQQQINDIKRSSSALLAEVLMNREYVDGELKKSKILQYIRLGLFVVLSLALFRALITRLRRQVQEKDVEVSKLLEDNTVLQKNTLEMLSIVKKLEQESSLLSASEDFEKRIKHDTELSTSLPNNFCIAYQKNISTFSFEHSKLSPAEVRTAVMLAMDIPTKSIVKLQCIESDTLKTYRKRIRRKLNMELGIDLNTYLKTLLYDLSKGIEKS